MRTAPNIIKLGLLIKLGLATALFASSALILLSPSTGDLLPTAFAGRCTSDSDCNDGLVCDPKWKVCELDDNPGGGGDPPPCEWELVWICTGFDGLEYCYMEWLERCD